MRNEVNSITEGLLQKRQNRIEESVISEAVKGVSDIFNTIDDGQELKAYSEYIAKSKQYKELQKVMQRYGLMINPKYKVRLNGEGSYEISLYLGRDRLGIDMTEDGVSFDLGGLSHRCTLIPTIKSLDAIIKSLTDLKEAAEAISKIGLGNLKSIDEFLEG